MGYRAVSQIVLFVISIVIVVTYIQPKLAEIRLIQDDIAEYKEAVDKATQLNSLLQTLLNRSGEFSQTEIRSLERYLPQMIDRVAVARDVDTMARNNQVFLEGISFESEALESRAARPSGQIEFEEGSETLEQAAEAALETEVFQIEVVGQYNNLVSFIESIEANAYPLEVVSLVYEGSSSGTEQLEYSFKIILETYALNTQS